MQEETFVGRRALVRGAAALAALAVATAAKAQARPYPDPDVIALDPRFRARLPSAAIEQVHTGMLWADGPAWNGVGRYLVWSDTPANEQLRWLEEDGYVARRFRSPAGNAAGCTFDYRGRQVVCEHGFRRVVRYEANGSMTILASGFEDKPFNAPHDAVVNAADGAVWFTDPGYGSLSDYVGHRLPSETVQPFQKEAIYRIDPGAGTISKVADQPFKPNGLCFSPDYATLYVSDSGSTHYPEAKDIIWAYDVVDALTLANPRTFADMALGDQSAPASGLRADDTGNVWAATGWGGDDYDGVHVFAPDGMRIGQVRLPEPCASLTFGGTERNRLFMTAGRSLYALYVEARGAHIA